MSGQEAVSSLAESLVWTWRMMKVGQSYSCGAPRLMEETQSWSDKGLRALQPKRAQEHSDPAIGLSAPWGVMRQRGENCHQP